MDNPDYSAQPYKYIYRASALGSCSKAQIANQLGYSALEIPQFFAGIFKEGRLHEPAIVQDLTESGYQVYDRELQVAFRVTKDVGVVGHIDGKLIELSGKHRLLEMKTMSDDAYKDFAKNGWDTAGLLQKYKWQVSTYMHSTGLPLTLIAKNRNNGRISYLYAEEPFYSKGQIMARVLAMHKWVMAGELPKDCDSADWPCPVAYLHEEPERAADEQDGPDPAEVEQVRALAGELREARAIVKKAEENRKLVCVLVAN